MQIHKLTDEQYHKIGGFNLQSPQNSIISASLLKDAFSRGLYEAVIEKFEASEDLKKIFEIGTITHLALLEPKEFEKKYYIGELNPIDDREHIKGDLAKLITEAKKQISLKYPIFFKEGKSEVSFLGEIDGVAVKAKMDKVTIKKDNSIVITDIKTTALPLEKIKKTQDGRAWEIDRTINDYHIDLQMYFYKRIIEEWSLQKYEFIPQIFTDLLFVSKADLKVRKIRLSDATIARGEEKFKSIWADVQAFMIDGLKTINDFEII